MERLKHPYRLLTILLCVLAFGLIAAACEDDPTEEPPAIPPPSNTLQNPFISATPHVTATLTPSHPPTPTVTATATDTATPITPTNTPTLSPTPPIIGSVRPGQPVRVREGPGTSFPIVVVIDPGTQVQVLGSEVNSLRETWYQLGFVDEDDNTIFGWILNVLVETAATVPTLGPTPTPLPTETAIGFVTVTPPIIGTPIEDVDPAELSDVNIWAYCEIHNGQTNIIQPRTARSDQTVSIVWSWFVTQATLMEDHFNAVDYDIRLNGQRLENWNNYRTEMRRDSRNNNFWTVYWYIPIGQMEPGNYTIDYKATWSEAVNDGQADFGPETENPEDVGTCRFTITDAG